MTGGAALVTGLLLIVAALAAPRIPGGATFARPGIIHSPIRALLLSPIHPSTWYANGAIALGPLVGMLAFGTIATIASLGFTTLLAGIGVLILAAGIEGSRLVARIERRRVFTGEETRPAAHAYRPLRGGIADLARAEFADENRWRDVLYVGVNLPLAILEFAVVAFFWTLALALLTTPLWYDPVPGATLPWFLTPVAGRDGPVAIVRVLGGAALVFVAASLSQLVIALHRGVVANLLCTSESRELRRRVERLEESRSAALEVEAGELQRIERDLHDGAQQRLVMLTIDLGLAGERLDTDPAAAKRLILDGQEQARLALAEIRQLVRGIAPSILLDRGLVAALESISGRGGVATAVRSDLAPGERFPPGVERTAYFVAAEALANVAKHSGATRCEVRLRREDGRLAVEVWDDGTGGAREAAGGGLAGLAGRVAAVDGTLTVSSPPGGPTLVRAEIPLGAGASAGAADRPNAAGQEPR